MHSHPKTHRDKLNDMSISVSVTRSVYALEMPDSARYAVSVNPRNSFVVTIPRLINSLAPQRVAGPFRAHSHASADVGVLRAIRCS